MMMMIIKPMYAVFIAIVAILYMYHHNKLLFHILIGIISSIVLFLGIVIGFVNYYIGKDLRKCSPLNEHLAYVNEETLSSQCIKDLDRVTNPHGLSQLWKDEIQDNSTTCRVLLTGVTGYVAKAFLFQLLRELAQAEENNIDNNNNNSNNNKHKVYVMVRPKARKNLTAAQRLEKMKNEPMFAAVQDQWDKVVVSIESGDLQEKECGMSKETLQILDDAKITHVVHCAADVNFNRPLAESAGINISPALQLQVLSSKWSSCKRFVHCSTAFVNPTCGTPDAPMREELFPLGKYDPQELYDSMRGDQKLALEAKSELRFTNNYVYSKCIAEHLVVRNNSMDTELRIVRPAIVGPAWVLPEPGWNGDKPSTITALFLLLGTRVIRFAPVTTNPLPIIPVDVVAVGILDAMISPTEVYSQDTLDEPIVSIRNLSWSHNSPKKFIDGISMAKRCLPVGVLKHHFTATEAAVSFALIDASSKYPFLFHPLHRIFNLGPLKLLQFVCWVARQLGIRWILDQLPIIKLLGFASMLILYRPFMARPHFFESSINVPASLDMNQYCISLFTATHAFWTKLFPGTVTDLYKLELIPNGRFDLWWALTLPCGTFKNRLIGYLACKIIRATYGSSLMFFTSLFHAGRTLLKLESDMNEQKHCVVLAPTHRSLMDYILVKYIAFSMVGLGIDVPTVYAQNEFDDPDLSDKIGTTKTHFDRHSTLASFLEGSPSPDGRLQKPSTTFLKALLDSSGSHDYTLIPLCIDYDRVDNDNAVMKEATADHSDLGLLDMIKLYLKIRASGKLQQSFGDVRVSLGVPTSLKTSNGGDGDNPLGEVACNLQMEHRRLTTVSEYQVVAAERYLDIPEAILRNAMEELGVNVCVNRSEKRNDFSFSSLSANDLWRLHLQWIPRFAPFLMESHPNWAKWILSSTDTSVQKRSLQQPEGIDYVLNILCSKFDAADALAKIANQFLRDQEEDVTLENLITEMSALDGKSSTAAGAPLYEAAASFILNNFV